MTEQAPIPDFFDAKARHKWIRDHANYFTAIRRKDRSYLREERPSFDEAVAYAQRQLKRVPDARFMIYAVYGQSDALVATVSADGVKEHI